MDPTEQNGTTAPTPTAGGPQNTAVATGSGTARVGGPTTTNVYVTPHAPSPAAPAPAPMPTSTTAESGFTRTTTTDDSARASAQMGGGAGGGPNAPEAHASGPAPTRTYTHRHINWRGIVKGALIVTAVAVVAVVGYMALASAMPMVVGTSGPLASAFGSTVGAIQTVFQGALGIAQIGFNVASTALINIGGWLGLSSAVPTVAATHAGVATGSSFFGWMGAGFASLVGIKAALPHLTQIPMTEMHTHTVPVDPATAGGVDHTQTQTMGHESAGHSAEEATHHAAEMGHHAGEDAVEGRAHARANIASTARIQQSWADRAANSRTASTIQPRQESYSAQADSDKAIANMALKGI